MPPIYGLFGPYMVDYEVEGIIMLENLSREQLEAMLDAELEKSDIDVNTDLVGRILEILDPTEPDPVAKAQVWARIQAAMQQREEDHHG